MKKYVLMNEWPVTVLVSLFKDAALKLMGQTNRALFHPLFHPYVAGKEINPRKLAEVLPTRAEEVRWELALFFRYHEHKHSFCFS